MSSRLSSPFRKEAEEEEGEGEEEEEEERGIFVASPARSKKTGSKSAVKCGLVN